MLPKDVGVTFVNRRGGGSEANSLIARSFARVNRRAGGSDDAPVLTPGGQCQPHNHPQRNCMLNA